MSEMTLVEQASRAMSRGAQNRTAPADLRESEPWQAHREDKVSREWQYYVPFVRDVLEAFRNPPSTVLGTAGKVIFNGDHDLDDMGMEAARQVINAAVDAALAEHPTV